MTTRLRILLVIGAAVLLAAFLALPRVLERVYRVDEWQPAWRGHAWVASGWTAERPRGPRIFFGRPIDREWVRRLDLDSGPTLVLRWSDGKLSWGGKEIEEAEPGPYVNGLLAAKKRQYVWVLMREGSRFGDVMSVVDKLHGVKARAIMLSEEH